MTFEDILDQAIAMLQRRGRLTYRTLQRQFQLDDAALDDLKHELIEGQRLAVDERGTVLVWTGDPAAVAAPASALVQAPAPLTYTPPYLAEKILTSRRALEGERKQVTVLFCDLTNSTALAERLGPEAMHTVLNRFFELALAEVHRYEGTINQFLGDGFMALFGAPLAHEDHARRAVLAALEIQQTLRQECVDVGLLAAGMAPASPLQLSVRMGLNTGLVVVGSIGDNLRMDYTTVGDTTNLAARLQQLAEPGAILLSETTTRLVRSEVRLETLEPVQVKGKTAPVVASRVLGLRPRRSPLAGLEECRLSPLVGRERELTALHELLAQAEAGQGQVVGLVGEAGVGKSRLLFEFRQRLREKRVTYLVAGAKFATTEIFVT
jgi:class 3 adenylate cyclase